MNSKEGGCVVWSLNNGQRGPGLTPIIQAAEKGRTETVKCLVEHKAKVNAISIVSKHCGGVMVWWLSVVCKCSKPLKVSPRRMQCVCDGLS